jgi:hypothetical protein
MYIHVMSQYHSFVSLGMYAYIYIYIYIYLYAWIQALCTFTQHMNTDTQTVYLVLMVLILCTYVHMCMHIYMFVCMRVCIYTPHKREHTHVFMNTCVCSLKLVGMCHIVFTQKFQKKSAHIYHKKTQIHGIVCCSLTAFQQSACISRKILDVLVCVCVCVCVL